MNIKPKKFIEFTIFISSSYEKELGLKNIDKKSICSININRISLIAKDYSFFNGEAIEGTLIKLDSNDSYFVCKNYEDVCKYINKDSFIDVNVISDKTYYNKELKMPCKIKRNSIESYYKCHNVFNEEDISGCAVILESGTDVFVFDDYEYIHNELNKMNYIFNN